MIIEKENLEEEKSTAARSFQQLMKLSTIMSLREH